MFKPWNYIYLFFFLCELVYCILYWSLTGEVSLITSISYSNVFWATCKMDNQSKTHLQVQKTLINQLHSLTPLGHWGETRVHSVRRWCTSYTWK